MGTSLSIRVVDGRTGQEERVVLRSGQSEVQLDHLLAELQDVLTLLKNRSPEVGIEITARTPDPLLLIDLLRRRTQREPSTSGAIMSKRELEVLDLIMQGLTNKEIAERLFISFDTVKCHRTSILAKTGSRNTAALVNRYHNIFRDRG